MGLCRFSSFRSRLLGMMDSMLQNEKIMMLVPAPVSHKNCYFSTIDDVSGTYLRKILRWERIGLLDRAPRNNVFRQVWILAERIDKNPCTIQKRTNNITWRLKDDVSDGVLGFYWLNWIRCKFGTRRIVSFQTARIRVTSINNFTLVPCTHQEHTVMLLIFLLILLIFKIFLFLINLVESEPTLLYSTKHT